MRKPSRHAEPENPTGTQQGSGGAAIPAPAGKGVGLSVIIETSAMAKRGRRRKQPVKVDVAHETGLDALAKLLVHHLEPDLREILK